ncbi:hypothetical protein QVD17_00716 [Tagetes erecta]|uniref:Transmembrane protein n=1 Tax=Tagetes erecta TaxID=13708 RepID=A0AAD8L9B3_TARER|nr:hypothetical protein QVD17_00716 [Tagetes erecta]
MKTYFSKMKFSDIIFSFLVVLFILVLTSSQARNLQTSQQLGTIDTLPAEPMKRTGLFDEKAGGYGCWKCWHGHRHLRL